VRRNIARALRHAKNCRKEISGSFDLDQGVGHDCSIGFLFMSKERAHDLAQQCTDLVRNGNDFPTVWHTVLKRNALVNGIPESRIEGGRPVLEIHLITGERLVFDGDARKFSVK